MNFLAILSNIIVHWKEDKKVAVILCPLLVIRKDAIESIIILIILLARPKWPT